MYNIKYYKKYIKYCILLYFFIYFIVFYCIVFCTIQKVPGINEARQDKFIRQSVVICNAIHLNLAERNIIKRCTLQCIILKITRQVMSSMPSSV